VKRILKIIAAVLGVIAALFVAASIYLGGFKTIVIEEKEMGPFTLVYKEMSGTDISQIGTITDEIESALNGAGFKTQKPFDLFHPDMRAEIGFSINESEVAKLSQLGATFKVKSIPAGVYMTTTFPWKMVASYAVGFMKVDPALETYRKKNDYRKTWAATRHDGAVITYLQPIEKELLAPQ
jgi:hypothetical protein